MGYFKNKINQIKIKGSGFCNFGCFFLLLGKYLLIPVYGVCVPKP